MVSKLKIGQVMSRALVSVESTVNVKAAADLMERNDVGSLLITQEGEIVGILTETDIVRRVLARGADPESTRVAEAMSAPVYAIEEGEPLEKARQLMASHDVRHLLVTRDRNPVGVISARNILDVSL